MSTLAVAWEHVFHGRLEAAAAVARSLLACDRCRDAALLLLEVRVEQGWFADAYALARERFRVCLPSAPDDCAATLRLHVARVWGGAEPEPALREIRSIAATARLRGDMALEGLAEDAISRTLRFAEAIRETVFGGDALNGLRAAIRCYGATGDVRSSLAATLRLGDAILRDDPERANRYFAEVERTASQLNLGPLVISARLCAAIARVSPPDDTDVDEIVAMCDAAGAPLLRGRALRQKTLRALAAGKWPIPEAAAARDAFRAQGAATDLTGFCGQMGKEAFSRGHFADAGEAASEAVALSRAMPFPHGEVAARLTMALALGYRGRLTEAAAELERVWSMASTYRRPRRLDLLPGVGLLLQVKQAARAARMAADYVNDLEGAGPTRELSLALHYLANANAVLARWPEVFAALERGAAVDDACGDEVSAIGKRAELAQWRFTEHWVRRKPIPHVIAVRAESTFDEAEQRLRGFGTREADLIRMTIHQMRSSLFKALERWDDVLVELEAFAAQAARLGSHVHEINAHVQAGLMLHDRGRHGNRAATLAAQRHLDAALAMQRGIGAPDAIASAAYLAASNERVLGRQSEAEEAAQHRSRVIELLEEADRCLTALLVGYEEPETEASDRARLALFAPWKKVYDLAVAFYLEDLHDAIAAFEWSERWKGRTLAMNLGALRLGAPAGVVAGTLEPEQRAIEALRRATTYEAIATARRRLESEWQRLAATLPEATEYVALRRGTAIGFEELTALLRSSGSH